MAKSKLYAYNLALKRPDGKIEQDTVYREKLLTRDDVVAIATKYSCDIIVSCVGSFTPATKCFIRENSFVVELPTPKVVPNE